MRLFGVYKQVNNGVYDPCFAEELVTCFESEVDAQHYVAIHNKPFVFDGENFGDWLRIKPINVVKNGSFDTQNNYGLAPNYESVVVCECMHATVIPIFNHPKQEIIKKDGVAVGVRTYDIITCEYCGKTNHSFEDVMMFDSEDEDERCRIANLGYNLEKYIHDPSSHVREIVAWKGVGHDVFIANPDEHPAVLRAIAKQGKYLDILAKHPNKNVSKTAQRIQRQLNKS